MNLTDLATEEELIASGVTKENVEMMKSAKDFLLDIPGNLTRFAWSLLIAVILLFIGFKVCKLIRKALRKIMEKANVDKAVINFTDATVNILIKAFLIFSAATIIGFEATGITAIIGSISIAIGLAVQGSLSNFAGGVLILTLKPFVIGDYIVETGTNKEGIVEKITIFYTSVRDDLGNIVILPNGTLANSTMVNKTNGNDYRYAYIDFQVAYKEDISKVRETVLKAMKKDTKFFRHDLEMMVVVTKLDDSGIMMRAKAAVEKGHFMDACFELNEIVKNALDEAGISIPFPQVDVHLDK